MSWLSGVIGQLDLPAESACPFGAAPALIAITRQAWRSVSEPRLGLADATFRAEDEAMDDCCGQNDGRAGKNWNDRSNQTDGEQHNHEEPPKEFHLIKS